MLLLSYRTWRNTLDFWLDFSLGSMWDIPRPKRKLTRSLTISEQKGSKSHPGHKPGANPRRQCYVCQAHYQGSCGVEKTQVVPCGLDCSKKSSRVEVPTTASTLGLLVITFRVTSMRMLLKKAELTWRVHCWRWEIVPKDCNLSFKPYESKVPSSRIQNSSIVRLRLSILCWVSFGCGSICSIS